MRVSTAVAVSAAAVVLSPATAFGATGLDAVRLQGATATGPMRGTVPVTVALAPRHKAALAGAAARGHGLTPAAFNRRFAPSRATVKAVRRWARARSLRVVSVSANRTLVRLSGSSAAIGRAFGTKLRAFRAPDGSAFFAPATRARLPRALRGRTTSVLGLSNLGHVAAAPLVRKSATSPIITPVPLPRLPVQIPPPGVRAAASQVSVPASYGPQDIAALYDAPASATGSGQSVAVIAEGDLTQPRADLVKFEDRFGLPHVTWNQITVGAPSSDTAGSDEWDLDTQYSTGMAPGVTQLNVYDGASLSNDDILATINRWVTDNLSRQGSFSAGECELLAFASGFTDSLDVTLQQAAAQGQTLFVSSGDTGVFCPAIVGVNGVPAGLPSTNYPAASPGAIGVGGTTVLAPGNEVGWYAGGGGTSYFEAAPAYQSGAGGSFLGVNRGVPDVALDADPLTGYTVIVAGQEETIGGTSASAPAWQGLWARIQGARGGSLGFAGPVLYGAPASAFHDVILGANGAPATPGWDYVTGRGTPDVAALAAG